MNQVQPKPFSFFIARLLARDILASFISGTLIFLFVMLMFQAIRLSEFLVIHRADIEEIGKISAYMLVSFLPIAIPVAFLFAVLMGVSRANSEGEVLALQLAGFSPLHIFTPLAIFSGFVAFISVYLSLFVVPRANRSFELMVGKIDSERVMASLKPGVFIHGFYGLVLFTEQISVSRNSMKKVFIYDNRESGHPLAITAQQGELQDFADRGLRTLRLRNGTIYIEKIRGDAKQQKIRFRIYDINLETGGPTAFWRDYSAPSYTYAQLLNRIEETKDDLPTHRRLHIELHRRFSLALSVIAFALVGFAIGCRSRRGVRSGAIVLCLFVGLIYWLTYLAATALAVTGWVLPWLGIWAPNVLLVVLGLFGFRRLYAY